MNDPQHPIDDAVRAYLNTEAAKVDAHAVLARVKAAQTYAVPSTRRKPWLRWAVTGTAAAIAACLVLGLFLTGNTPVPETTLSATELIRKAKSVHEVVPTDRCYDVSADWDVTPFLKRFRFQPIRQGKVWTRGDQFVMLSSLDDGPQWAWGQELSGRVWLAPTQRHAIVFDKDELNEPLGRFCELMSLRLVSTLGELLEKYELLRKDGGGLSEPIRIEAKLRPALFPQARFRKVELELDRDTKVVRRAVLHRSINGESVGTLTFTLTETTTQPDDFYGPRAHLDPNAIVHDGKPMPTPPNARARFGDEVLRRLQNRIPR